MFIWDKLTAPVLVSEIPSAVEFWIVPPLSAAPVPVTVRLPAPVALSAIPLAAPFDEMVRNVSPLVPIVVLATFSAVPVVVVSVLATAVPVMHGFSSQTLTVPPLVALNAVFAPVDRTRPPEKVIVPLSLLSRLTPVPVPAVLEIAPV